MIRRPITLDGRCGLILLAWGFALVLMPSMQAFVGYRHFERAWAWAGRPQIVLSFLAALIGTGVLASDRFEWDRGRRFWATLAIGFWLTVGSGFVGPEKPFAAVVIYFGAAWQHHRTARGLPPL